MGHIWTYLPLWKQSNDRLAGAEPPTISRLRVEGAAVNVLAHPQTERRSLPVREHNRAPLHYRVKGGLLGFTHAGLAGQTKRPNTPRPIVRIRQGGSRVRGLPAASTSSTRATAGATESIELLGSMQGGGAVTDPTAGGWTPSTLICLALWCCCWDSSGCQDPTGRRPKHCCQDLFGWWGFSAGGAFGTPGTQPCRASVSKYAPMSTAARRSWNVGRYRRSSSVRFRACATTSAAGDRGRRPCAVFGRVFASTGRPTHIGWIRGGL